MAPTTRFDSSKNTDTVRNQIVSMDSLNIALDARFEKQLSEISNVVASKMETALQELNNKIEENKTNIISNTKKLKSITKQIQTIQTSLSNINIRENCNPTPLDIETICNEIRDRENRAKNILVFGLPESNDPNADLTEFNNLLIKLALDVKPLRLIRLGKSTANKPRPAKIIFESIDNVIKIFKLSKSFIKYNLKIDHDKTIRERDILKNLRLTLNNRIQNGEKNLTIKYVNNIPTIVEKNV